MSPPDPWLMANAIRFLSIDAIERVGDGHPGTPLGAADTVTALFTRHLKFNPADPTWFDRDRFVESNGHGSMLLYSLLYLTGYEKITLDEIRTFRELGSHCEGHPELDPAAGIEITTGPLGQGIANAAGMAVAEAFLSQWLGPEHRRPPHLRAGRRRLPAGGRRARGDLAGRSSAGSASSPSCGTTTA